MKTNRQLLEEHYIVIALTECPDDTLSAMIEHPITRFCGLLECPSADLERIMNSEDKDTNRSIVWFSNFETMIDSIIGRFEETLNAKTKEV